MMNLLTKWISSMGVEDAWVYTLFLIVFLTMLASYIARKLLRAVEAQLHATHNAWDDALMAAARRPLSAFIWVIGFSFIFKFIEVQTEGGIFTRIDEVVRIAVIVLLGWFLFSLAKELEKNLLNPNDPNKKVDETTVSVLARLARASVVITTGLVIMQAMGYSVSGVLAFGGIGGVAIGFAAREMLSNFFGAAMIYLDRPFAIGDWVRSPDRSIEGTVESIGWRMTVIRTFDKRPLYVPNSAFSSISVENPSRMSHRRIKETIGIRYDDVDKTRDIMRDVKQMLIDHEGIDHSQTLIVNFNAFAPSSLDFFIYTFTKTTNWIQFHEVKQDVLLKISDIISGHGAEIAFPTSTIQISEPNPEP